MANVISNIIGRIQEKFDPQYLENLAVKSAYKIGRVKDTQIEAVLNTIAENPDVSKSSHAMALFINECTRRKVDIARFLNDKTIANESRLIQVQHNILDTVDYRAKGNGYNDKSLKDLFALFKSEIFRYDLLSENHKTGLYIIADLYHNDTGKCNFLEAVIRIQKADTELQIKYDLDDYNDNKKYVKEINAFCRGTFAKLDELSHPVFSKRSSDSNNDQILHAQVNTHKIESKLLDKSSPQLN